MSKNSGRIGLDLVNFPLGPSQVVSCIPPALHLRHAKPRPPSRASQTASIMGSAEGACKKYLPLPHSKHLDEGWHLGNPGNCDYIISDKLNATVAYHSQCCGKTDSNNIYVYIYITIIIGLQSTRVCKMAKMCNYEPD